MTSGQRDPGRTLVLAQLVNTLGNGAFVTTSALYFTRVVGFSAAQFGVGLSIAGVAGLLAGVPFGHLADRRGARGVTAWLMALAGLATASYLVIRSFPLFVVAAVLYALFDRGGYAARQALVGRALSGENLVKVRAKMRVVTNVGYSLGAGLGGLALSFDTRPAYLLALGLDALSFVGCALLLLRLPTIDPVPAGPPGEPRLAVLRDRPYALLALINMVMLLHSPLLDVALPLWISSHTAAPRWMAAALYVLNTGSVVLFQVRLTKGIDALAPALRAFRLAGVGLMAACVAFSFSSGRSAVAAVALLVVGAGLHVYGEMVQSAGSWVIGYDLAPADKQGQYQGLFNTGIAATQMFAPAVLTVLLIDWGAPGWLVLGGVFLVGGLAMAPAVRWAERSRAEAEAAGADAAVPVA
ncbi:MFS transporter [Streptacidiphilus jiangxiensis]|uniref:Predicted arabinose efflux permease, MFS family n=1 Tax=Streptacidiphilus jiangxiensis TaxID=235985 RepID=A0A1H7Y3S8_STRJI|nr:MFS transporter [Streptacidiphilus jiangxiensis]SEM40643.1 Predicted arabinose efflux permease, MFS family [Streptacidiphilus jiangxiensis]